MLKSMEPLGFLSFKFHTMPSNTNRGRYSIALHNPHWSAYAEPLPGLRFIGVITRRGETHALAVNDAGEYFAVLGRRTWPLIARKVNKALEAANDKT